MSIPQSRVNFNPCQVYAFLQIPWELEQFLLYGLLQCIDAFAYLFTFLPIRFVVSSYIFVTTGPDIRHSRWETGSLKIEQFRLSLWHDPLGMRAISWYCGDSGPCLQIVHNNYEVQWPNIPPYRCRCLSWVSWRDSGDGRPRRRAICSRYEHILLLLIDNSLFFVPAFSSLPMVLI